jgi:hypothetical protein
LKCRFLGDANFNWDILSGVLRREPRIDFLRAESNIPGGTEDPGVLALAASLGSILVTHDVITMPWHFADFITSQICPGVILVPQTMSVADAIEDLLLVREASQAEEWKGVIGRLQL